MNLKPYPNNEASGVHFKSPLMLCERRYVILKNDYEIKTYYFSNNTISNSNC